MMSIFRKVLDIDLISGKYSRTAPKTKEEINNILQKIRSCKNNKKVSIKSSSFKGYLIEVFCKKDCDICRICYDDDKHFAYDMNRPKYARNILFNKKERIKIEI